jgi:hypothetical protein
MNWGTLQVSDTLQSLALAQGLTIAQFGVAETYALVERDLNYHNQLVNTEMIPDLCWVTDQREEQYGIQDDMTVEEIDEFGRPDTQKLGFATTMGFPLSSYGRSVGWTWDYAQVQTPGQLVEQVTAIKGGDLKGIRLNIARRLFNPANNLTYKDRKIDNKTLKLRALINADGEQVMPGPEMQAFNAGTHTHYTATNNASLTNTAVTALVNNVLEHGRVGELCLYINLAQEAAIRGFNGANEFTPYVDVRIRQSQTAVYAIDDTLDLDTPEDRAIGIYGAAKVYVKPWIPSGYLLCVDKGAGNMKPLAYRTRPGGALSDLGLRGRIKTDDFPLYAETLARDYGVGVWQRHMAACLQIVASTTYSAPSI